MRRRHLQGLALFHEEDKRTVDWSLAAVRELHSEQIQRQAGATGVERDGKHWRARPMAGGVKHALGEFATEDEAVAKVRAFWLEWLGLPADATQEQLDEARKKDSQNARDVARDRKKAARVQKAKEAPTPLFG